MTRGIDLVLLMRSRIDQVLDLSTSPHYDKRNRSNSVSMYKSAL